MGGVTAGAHSRKSGRWALTCGQEICVGIAAACNAVDVCLRLMLPIRTGWIIWNRWGLDPLTLFSLGFILSS